MALKVGRTMAATLAALALLRGPASAQPGAAIHGPTFPVTGLVGLGTDDAVLAWNHASAQAQVRTKDGVWNETIKLPLDTVTEVETHGSQVLVAGGLQGKSVAVLLDAELAELARWNLERMVHVDFGASGPRALNAQFTRALLPGGTLGPPQPLPSRDERAARRLGRPRLFDTPGGQIVCRPADERKTVDAPATCARLGDAPWLLTRNVSNPLMCGKWLVAFGENGPRWRMWIYSIGSGKLVASRATAREPTVRCVANHYLLSADLDLRLLELPKLKTRWSKPISEADVRMQPAVADLVVSGDAAICRMNGTNEITATKLPAIAKAH